MSGELVDLVLSEADEKMAKTVARTRHEFSTIRTGRPSPALVERIPIDYFGSEVPLQQLASFSVPEAQLLVISPFDKGSIEAIEKAVLLADLGVSPSNDGSVLRLNFPPLTEERRKQLVKVVKTLAEEGRVAIRGVRRSARQDLDALGKDGDASSDETKRASDKVDTLTRRYEDEINITLTQKESELLEV
ncbi:MAG: ribosome recycling factor [Acidimicrobiales bacterium]|jgi:ribosome recycling factor|nr:ribosome recycling factor [Acidimicrobiales bacterium]MDP6297781.1 ribosome recycling factor [Acidimicrobiales bacterium]HJM27622.1 ribosome recycling factor [Acidimicrobiales bacterium]HJM98021.1 ribosome recycling factor [Acidimicrobiales bacterium]